MGTRLCLMLGKLGMEETSPPQGGGSRPTPLSSAGCCPGSAPLLLAPLDLLPHVILPVSHPTTNNCPCPFLRLRNAHTGQWYSLPSGGGTQAIRVDPRIVAENSGVLGICVGSKGELRTLGLWRGQLKGQCHSRIWKSGIKEEEVRAGETMNDELV